MTTPKRELIEYVRIAIGFVIAVLFGFAVKYAYAPEKGSISYYGFVFGGGLAVFILMHIILGRFLRR